MVSGMPALTLELPKAHVQRERNVRRWAELLADRELARFEGRIETDRYGRIIMSPPPAPHHGSLQSEIAYQLRSLMDRGRVLTECPVSTADGVKGADVAWASPECIQELGNRSCFVRLPEICIEVVSPGNTQAEVREKVALYFDAGTKEVWLCGESGEMTFFGSASAKPQLHSALCPEFPKRIVLST
jgi:Uma2 family endonuclease